MSGLLPVAVYGLKVPAGDVMVPSIVDFPATFRLTMAAIDPSAEPEHAGTVNGDTAPRATLKLVYDRSGPSGDEDSERDSEGEADDQQLLKTLLQGKDSDEDDDDEDEEDESSSDDEEINGGPSDPSKSKKARRQAAADQLMKALMEPGSEDEMDVDGVNGASAKKRSKGKGKAMSKEDEEDSEEEDDDSKLEEVVVCTLDPQKNYQQPLDLTIGEDQRAYFKVSGTHAIYLTGNYVIPADSSHRHEDSEYEDSEDDYDLSPDEDELDEEDESDELDNLKDPRITEVDTDEEAPKLVKNEQVPKKGKNKRAAEDSEEEKPTSLDDIMAKSLKPEPTTNGEPKLSKKQMKKLKNNAGKAVEAAIENQSVRKENPATKDNLGAKTDKKVQFAKNLEQGPSGTSKDSKANAKEGAKEPTKESKKEAKKESKAEPEAQSKVNGETPKASLGPKTLQGGVKIEDKKLGQGPACKKGNKVGMRYIGKLLDGKVFDGMYPPLLIWIRAHSVPANKKGAPFTFTLGTGEVIKGWDIGVAGMSIGGERRIEVPANLAYGSKSMPGIPANSVLKFEVKLLTIS
ncbi:MAG: hypothetical protein Q9216_004404 [Gyalolechia sp. 2 TL-2023]